ncbi:MAG: hypothetical protein QF652_07960 [Dehalococcoidia bacterium]|nr:hypothetical protein [Dehalococcoidia bacterium]
MLDAVEVERAGLPAVAVITDEFGDTARAMLKNQGASWYRFVEVAHPINILEDHEIDDLVGRSLHEISALLTGET